MEAGVEHDDGEGHHKARVCGSGGEDEENDDEKDKGEDDENVGNVILR